MPGGHFARTFRSRNVRTLWLTPTLVSTALVAPCQQRFALLGLAFSTVLRTLSAIGLRPYPCARKEQVRMGAEFPGCRVGLEVPGWFGGFAFRTRTYAGSCLFVISAEAGIHGWYETWACAYWHQCSPGFNIRLGWGVALL
jgi:hypothetical protein